MKIVGISGGSGAGKSTVSKGLVNILPNSIFIDVDPYFREATDKLEDKIFSEIHMEKEEGVLNQNYFFSSLEAMNTWIRVISDYVNARIEEVVSKLGEGKDYVIVDWCYLPMCDFFKKCDYTFCVKADYATRYKRLENRMRAVSGGYSIAKGPSFSEYKKKSFENRVKYSAINEYGYKSDFNIVNDKDLETLYRSISVIAKGIMEISQEPKKMSVNNRRFKPDISRKVIQTPIIQTRGAVPQSRTAFGQYFEYSR